MKRLTGTAILLFLCVAVRAAEPVTANPLSEYGREVWEKTTRQLDDILETQDEYYRLPEKRIWPLRDKADADEDLMELYDSVIAVMQISGLRELCDEYAQVNDDIGQARLRLQDYRESRVAAPDEKSLLSFTETRDDIGRKIEKEQGHIEELLTRQQEILGQIVQLFSENGMHVTRDQARLYLSLSSSDDQDDIIALYSIYFNVRELNRQVADQIRAGHGEPDTIKRYYGMHVVLTRTMLIGYDRVLQRIRGDYLPRIEKLRGQAQKAESMTQELMRREELSDSQRSVLAGNYEAQQKFIEICDASKRYMNRMYDRLKQQRDRVKTNYEIAENTYMTAWVGAGLLETVNQFNSDVQALQKMTLEPVIPLTDEVIMKQFDEFTQRL